MERNAEGEGAMNQTAQDRTVLRRGTLYRLGENMTWCLRELRRFGVEVTVKNADRLRARWGGEKRAPRAGEWFLSGSEIEAYRTTADMTSVYHIAEIVFTEEVVTTRVIEPIQKSRPSDSRARAGGAA